MWPVNQESLQRRREGSRLFVCLCLIGGIAALAAPRAAWGLDESGVLVLYNADNADSVAVAQYYQQVHPDVQAMGLNLGQVGEAVSAQYYLDNIRAPVYGTLSTQAWGEGIDAIVTTMGMPLRIDAGPDPNPGPSSYWRRYSSLESELTRVDTISTIAQMGDQDYLASKYQISTIPGNPYYLGPETDFLTGAWLPYDGPEGFDRDANEQMRLSTRLDAFAVQDVYDMIDRAQTGVCLPLANMIVADDDPNAPNGDGPWSDRMTGGFAGSYYIPGLDDILDAANQAHLHNNTPEAITTASNLVAGYVSHGTHDSGTLVEGYIEDQLAFDLADGAVFHSYESFNAVSFEEGGNYGQQPLIAEWIATGGTAALGHVQEPLPDTDGDGTGEGSPYDAITNEDIFFDMLLNGYTLAEAAWAATRQLSYVNTVVGDPLMRWRTFVWGDINDDGKTDALDIPLFNDMILGDQLFDEAADINVDGSVDALDILLFVNLVLDSSGGSDTQAVPEPAALSLLLLLLPVLHRRRARAA